MSSAREYSVDGRTISLSQLGFPGTAAKPLNFSSLIKLSVLPLVGRSKGTRASALLLSEKSYIPSKINTVWQEQSIRYKTVSVPNDHGIFTSLQNNQFITHLLYQISRCISIYFATILQILYKFLKFFISIYTAQYTA